MGEEIENDFYLAKWLEGEITDLEFKEYINEEDFKLYIKLKKGIDVYSKLEEPAEVSFKRIQEKLENRKPKVRKFYGKWLSGIAAMILVSLGLFSIFNDTGVTVETGYGESQIVNLLDGSEVILNSKSKIDYVTKNWEENRTLTLDGEAYFSVFKGSEFTVNTTQGNVKVLGTKFNVNGTDDYFEVTCYEGKVAVTASKKEYILAANQHVRILPGEPVENRVVVSKKPSWIDGESSFESVPVKYVITALEKQYGITIDSKQIDDTIVYTGSFSHANEALALQTVFQALKIKVINNGNKSIRLSYDK